MSTEERLVRPYLGVDRIQQVLESAQLLFGGDVVEPGGRLTVPLLDFVTRPIRIRIGRDATACDEWRLSVVSGVQEIGLDPEDVELIILVSTPRLRLSEIVRRFRLADVELPHEITIAAGEERPPAMQAPRGGADVTFLICLSKQVTREVLRPWRKGTWLGKIEFALRSDAGERGFEPIALDSEGKARLGLDPATSRYVRIADPSLLSSPDVGEEIVELYVDKVLLAQISHDSTSAWSRVVQAQLFIDAITAITYESARRTERPGSFAEIDGSLLARVVDMAAGSGTDREARRNILLRLLFDDPARFVARLEARTEHLADTLEAARGSGR